MKREARDAAPRQANRRRLSAQRWWTPDDVRRLLRDLGETRAGLARRLGVHPRTVGKWVRGATGVGLAAGNRLAELARPFASSYPAHLPPVAPDELRALRECLGDSRYAFGLRLGVAEFQVWQWETGRRTPSVPTTLAVRALQRELTP